MMDRWKTMNIYDILSSTRSKDVSEMEKSGQSEHILVCISPSPSNPKVVAAAARMAVAFRATLTAIYVKPTNYDALTEAEIKYGHADELAPLAALSLSDTPIPTLVEEIKEADEFLKDQKGYGTKEDELKKRALHAVMIVSDQYQGTDQVNVTLMTNTLDMLFAKQQASRFSFAVLVVEALLKMVAASHEGKDETKVETDNKSDAQKQPEE